jgi:transposase
MHDPTPSTPQQSLAPKRAQLIIQVRSGSLSAKEAARQLQTSRKTYYKWERRGLAAMVKALANGKTGRKPLPIKTESEIPDSLFEEIEESRKKELQLFVFMLRFALGPVTTEGLKRHLQNKLPSKDLATLHAHLTSRSPLKRMRALIVVFHLCRVPTDSIVNGLGIYDVTVKKYLRIFSRSGVEGLFPPRKGVTNWEDPRYKEALFGILHSPPLDHGFNRTTWRGKDLACVMARIGLPIGMKRIGAIISNAGYRFMKAKEVLTSNDPNYREKVDRIHRILSRLKPREHFFSIDEFGPLAVKKHGGRRLVAPGEYPTVPQFQKSKGCLIVTAALELSTNQVTHFYSSGKNTGEMIRLLEVLLNQYRDRVRLYLSWDDAGWHTSKKFMKKVEEINTRMYRREHGTPIVELAPLPARAQFLNVIESVFSGLAVSVIHNRDYASVDDAKTAIDRYFAERNLYFRKNPKRAGNKIWGKERVAATFRESHNCKNPHFR